MFRRKAKPIGDLLNEYLRAEGLETPLLQKRLIDSWPVVMGAAISRYTDSVFIKNQTLFVKISSPSLRADLSMMRAGIVKRLNSHAGSDVIADVRFY